RPPRGIEGRQRGQPSQKRNLRRTILPLALSPASLREQLLWRHRQSRGHFSLPPKQLVWLPPIPPWRAGGASSSDEPLASLPFVYAWLRSIHALPIARNSRPWKAGPVPLLRPSSATDLKFSCASKLHE